MNAGVFLYRPGLGLATRACSTRCCRPPLPAATSRRAQSAAHRAATAAAASPRAGRGGACRPPHGLAARPWGRGRAGSVSPGGWLGARALAVAAGGGEASRDGAGWRNTEEEEPALVLPDPSQLVELTEEEKARVARDLRLVALRVPASSCGTLMKSLRKHLLNWPRVVNVAREDGDDGGRPTRLLLLSEALAGEGGAVPAWEALPEGVRNAVEAAVGVGGGVEEGCEDGMRAAELVPHTLHLGYEHWDADDALARILPEGVMPPGSYQMAGHVVQLNLEPPQLPFRFHVGRVLLDKLGPRVRTVVNKTASVGSKHRVFQMELLAGEPDLAAVVSEGGLDFQVDLGKMYWNSRLSTERQRVLALVGRGDLVLDACCGAGPFAVAAARTAGAAAVRANDLNPWAAEACRINADKNHVGSGAATHVFMNLPTISIELLASLRGELDAAAWEGRDPPTVHAYAFTRSADEAAAEGELRGRVEEAIGGALPGPLEVALVRLVAPGKHYCRATFKLPVEAGGALCA